MSDIGIPFFFLSEARVRGPQRTKAGQVIAFISSGVSPAPGELSGLTGLVPSKVKVAKGTGSGFASTINCRRVVG